VLSNFAMLRAVFSFPSLPCRALFASFLGDTRRFASASSALPHYDHPKGGDLVSLTVLTMLTAILYGLDDLRAFSLRFDRCR
jgi:hypothetical protein